MANVVSDCGDQGLFAYYCNFALLERKRKYIKEKMIAK
jgi:hypothetical protein